MTSGIRQRAAYLHIAKCAGTSLTRALTEAAGQPRQPEARLDACYTFGSVERSTQSEAARRMILDPHDVDPARPPGSHVFETHWSLPTLRTWFAPDDIATVLREPTMRLLSSVLFAHTRTQSQRRTWYPDDVSARMVRRPLVELLRWAPAARATDNLAVRQLLWGDDRVVGDDFVRTAHVDGLAADATAALEGFGFVGVIEAAEHAADGLGRWLGRSLDVGHTNRTAEVSYTGLVTPSTDLDAVHQLLLDRTAADRIVWAHEARRCGIDPDDASFERAVGARLRRLSTSSSFVLWSGASDSEIRPTAQARFPSTRVLVVGDRSAAAEHLGTLGDAVDVTHVRSAASADDASSASPGRSARVRSAVVESIESVDLRALLAGRDFDVAIVSARRDDGARTARQLADSVVQGGSLLFVGSDRDRIDSVDAQLWTTANGEHGDEDAGAIFVRTAAIAPIESIPDDGDAAGPRRAATMSPMDTSGASEVVADGADGSAGDDWSRYGEAILLDNPTDSRAIVLGLLDGGPKRILELGCSAGLMTRVLHQRGHQVTGIEIDPVAAELCRPFTEELLVGDLDDSGADDLLGRVEPQGFDVLLAADVLEHLRDPLGALQRASAALAPGGTAILSIPNVAHGDVRLALLAGRFDYRSNGLLDRTHVQLFTLASLTEMIRSAGLVPVSWLRSTRAVGTTEIDVDEALFEFGRRAFANDPEIDTYQWIVTCRRDDDALAVPDWPASTDSPVAANVAPMLDVTVPQPAPASGATSDAAGRVGEGAAHGNGAPAHPSVSQQVAEIAQPLVARMRRVAGRILRAVKG